VRVQWIANAPLNDKGYRHLAMMNSEMQDGAGIRQLAAASQGKPRNTAVAAAEPPQGEEQPETTTIAYTPPPAPPVQTAAADSDYVTAGFVVHVATFGNRDNADAAYEELSQSMDLQMFQFESDNGPLYRLQTRPVPDESGAAQLLYKLQDAGFTGAKIRRVRVQQVAARIAG
jgi:cell division septation protein DedD